MMTENDFYFYLHTNMKTHSHFECLDLMLTLQHGYQRKQRAR